MRGRWLLIARIAWLLLLAVVVTYLVASRGDQVSELFEDAAWGGLTLALILLLAQVPVNAEFWISALRSQAETPVRMDVVVVSARTLLARYVPGSVWYAAGRVALLGRTGLATSNLVVTAVLEMIMSLVIVFTLGLGLLAVAGRLPGGAFWLFPLAVLAVAALSKPVVNRALAWVARRRGTEAVYLQWGGYGRMVGWMSVFWVWSAATFVVYLNAFPNLPTPDPVEVAGAFMVAWGIGFLTPIAPQGVGIFEITLATILADSALGDVAIVIAGFRVLGLLRDILATGAGELIDLLRRRARRGSETREQPSEPA